MRILRFAVATSPRSCPLMNAGPLSKENSNFALCGLRVSVIPFYELRPRVIKDASLKLNQASLPLEPGDAATPGRGFPRD